MRGHDKQDERLEEFIAARTQDLHHDAYQLTAAQQPAEQLVVMVLAEMRRERVELAQAGATARLRMTRAAARDSTPSEITDIAQLPAQFQLLASLSPRQRAVLLLQVVDNYDERETARALRLSSRATTETLQSIPYDELPGASPRTGELRSLLEDFGDLAIAPNANTTLGDVRAAPPPPRRPWWTYVAALLVVALTVGCLVVTQRWHDDWLRTPQGLNHAHGTHFPAYTQGYKLIDIREVKPGVADEFDAGSATAVTMDCGDLSPGFGMSVTSGQDNGTYFQRSCGGQPTRTMLTAVTGTVLLSINDFSRHSWPVAVYRQVPFSEYPVATSNFKVQRNLTLDSMRSVTTGQGKTLRPTFEGTVLTLHGDTTHPNGRFQGTLHLPSAASFTELDVVALLSPTTTGRYTVQLNHRGPMTNCGTNQTVNYQELQPSSPCSLVDHAIPQVQFQQPATDYLGATSVPIDITVQGARGPWTLQVVADRYKLDASAVDDGGNG